MNEQKWIDVKDGLPEAKEGWEHSKQVLVHYDGIPNEKVECYSIAYYHYNPPFRKAGWIDFNSTRFPTHWLPIPPLKNEEEK